ncbi:hypothetical protein [Bifidobacterium aquikefiricola]|uniref:Uncharacterized protein n=1 Tax=Bifidobacterium aquikefiricola TaxID=3059038 RepID=A0AB39U7W1_9BIFI
MVVLTDRHRAVLKKLISSGLQADMELWEYLLAVQCYNLGVWDFDIENPDIRELRAYRRGLYDGVWNIRITLETLADAGEESRMRQAFANICSGFKERFDHVVEIRLHMKAENSPLVFCADSPHMFEHDAMRNLAEEHRRDALRSEGNRIAKLLIKAIRTAPTDTSLIKDENDWDDIYYPMVAVYELARMAYVNWKYHAALRAGKIQANDRQAYRDMWVQTGSILEPISTELIGNNDLLGRSPYTMADALDAVVVAYSRGVRPLSE